MWIVPKDGWSICSIAETTNITYIHIHITQIPTPYTTYLQGEWLQKIGLSVL